MTGEISIRGKVKPVGGVVAKVEAAKQAGIKRVIIPKENWQELFNDIGIEVICADNIDEIIEMVFNRKAEKTPEIVVSGQPVSILTATGA